jgi:hypothetical protein
MTDPTRPFPDDYLAAYSTEHVAYEFDMLLTLSSLISRLTAIHAPSVADQQCLNYALLESCAVHTRNVIDFLYPNRVQPTDVVAADFFDPGTWDATRPPLSESLRAARTRANKEIAHLTTARLTGAPPEKGWNFPELAAELLPIMRLMAHEAMSSRVSPALAGRFE